MPAPLSFADMVNALAMAGRATPVGDVIDARRRFLPTGEVPGVPVTGPMRGGGGYSGGRTQDAAMARQQQQRDISAMQQQTRDIEARRQAGVPQPDVSPQVKRGTFRDVNNPNARSGDPIAQFAERAGMPVEAAMRRAEMLRSMSAEKGINLGPDQIKYYLTLMHRNGEF